MYKLLLVCLALIAVASAQYIASPYAYPGLYRSAGVYGAYPYSAGVYGGYAAAPVAYTGYGAGAYLYK